jgi:hypothetical protein
MLSKQLMESLQTAKKSKGDVVFLNNTAANGADYYIKPYESLIFVNNDGSYTQNIFLPAVGESVGAIITIVVPDFGGGGTIADQDDSLAGWTDLTNNADDEFAVVYNDGIGWKTLVTTM